MSLKAEQQLGSCWINEGDTIKLIKALVERTLLIYGFYYRSESGRSIILYRYEQEAIMTLGQMERSNKQKISRTF